MLEILSAPSHVAAFRLAGTLSGEDYDRCIAEIESKLARHDRIAIYCDMSGMTGLDPFVVPKDIRYSLGKLGEFHRFARGAVVTGQEWVARITTFSGMFLPRTDVRTFRPGERNAALEWAGAPLPGSGAIGTG